MIVLSGLLYIFLLQVRFVLIIEEDEEIKIRGSYLISVVNKMSVCLIEFDKSIL